MASGITLSAGVRRNLLSLQSTADMMASTQNRLATGKKVNSALDNPSNFFTASSLSDRAGDLNSLLDSIGQATSTLGAANNGITSLTKLVQSAKSIAQQARQASQTADTYSAVTSSGSVQGTETLASAQGADFSPRAIGLSFTTQAETAGTVTATNTLGPKAISLAFTTDAETLGQLNGGVYGSNAVGGDAGNLVIDIGGVDHTIALANGNDLDTFVATFNGTSGLGATGAITASNQSGVLRLTANNADVDFTVDATSTAATLNKLGLTSGTVTNSTSLLDNIGAGQSLTIGVTGFSDRTVNFSTAAGANNVSTLAELDTWLSGLGGVTADVTGTSFTISTAAAAGKSVTLTASNAATSEALGLDSAATGVNLTSGANRGGLGAALTRTFNSDVTLGEIDPTNLSSGGNLVISLDKNDGTTTANQSIALAATDTLEDVRDKIAANSVLAGHVDVSIDTNRLKLDSTSVKDDFTVVGNAVSAALGLTTNASTNNTGGLSTSLLDNIIAAGGASGATLALDATTAGNGTVNTITFAKGSGTGGNVSTLQELSNYISSSGGAISGGVTANTFTLNISAGAGKSLGMTASHSAVKTALGLGTAQTDTAANGTGRGGLTSDPTKLTRTFNSDLTLGEIESDFATTGGNFAIGIDKNDGNGNSVQTIGLASTDKLSDIVTKLKANTTINDNLDVSVISGRLNLKAKNSDVDFEVTSNAVSTALNTGGGGTLLTANQGKSTSLLDNLLAAGGVEGQSLTIQANGGEVQKITFGKGTGQVSTLSDLNTVLSTLGSGVSASLSGTSLSFTVASGNNPTKLTIGGDTAVVTQLGISAGTKEGEKSIGSGSSTRTSLQNDFNDVLTQIDALSKDSSYNGINLLNGDDLKVSFNEDGSSSLTIKGVTYNADNLGMNKQNGDAFQDNAKIDATISKINDALTSLRTQGSKFGANLTTVQTRQDFTKNMINTLQTGADALVLADTNEEGANLLALQTRQQLSTTALSMSAQQDQAVLRLF